MRVEPDRHWVESDTRLDFACAQPLDSIRLVLQGDMVVKRVQGRQVAGFRTIADPTNQRDTLVVRFRESMPAGRRVLLRVAAEGEVMEAHLSSAVNSFSPAWTEWTEQTAIIPTVLLSGSAARFAYELQMALPVDYTLQAAGRVVAVRAGRWVVKDSIGGHFGVYFAKPLQQRQTRVQGITLAITQPAGADSVRQQVVATAAAAATFYNALLGPQQQLTYVKMIVPPRPGSGAPAGWSYAVPGGIIRLQLTGNRVNDFYSIGHELAHQWWYAAPFSNTNYQSFLNEGFAEYCCLLFYRSEFGQEAFAQLLTRYQRIAESLGSIRLMPGGLAEKQRNQYTYIKAAYTLYQLEQKIGAPAMQRLLQEALRQHPQSYQQWLELVEQQQGPAARQFYESVF
ncbi:hypothetical protein E5K00_14340 [Hymenobacter aquaticus]|uniref:Peptidase M1 membrane alanine aminopeptidase domain-containing protein n=1 Tax=Hymenobacter aquaticus TaxID=1867101 RepID=A0A4Z0PX03_9BACT|nr:M1 family metallopeptidase [Hymenobacter aquaticus]TGE21461.1 hypothetical protein E5K00_14340 [Hymenobacter aquaticus]